MNSIGSHTFRSMPGNPDTLKERCLVRSRPGVAGAAVWRLGKLSEPFTVHTVSSAASIEDGRAMYVAFCGEIAKRRLSMVWAGCSLDDEGLEVVVRDVRQTALYGVLNDTAGARALLECDWDLVAVPKEG